MCNEVGKEALYTISTGPTGARCYAEYRMLDSSKFPENTTTQEMLQSKYSHFYKIVKKHSEKKDKKPKVFAFDVENLITGEVIKMNRNEVVKLLSNGNGAFFTNLKLNGPNNIGGKKHTDYNEVEIIFLNE